MSEVIRVFLADDHNVVRRGLEALIETEEDMIVVGTAADGIEAVKNIASSNPDVVLLDLKMPRKSGLEAIPEIRAVDPRVRIMMLTSFGDKEGVFDAIKAGALGYLLKDCRPEELLQAIRNTYLGKSTLSPDIALKVIEEINKPAQPHLPLTEEPLTEREVELLQYVARGMSNQEIADELVLSERTVRTHISNILSKLHLADRTQAAVYAWQKGVVGRE